jgi:hypothetical protein
VGGTLERPKFYSERIILTRASLHHLPLLLSVSMKKKDFLVAGGGSVVQDAFIS